MTQHRSLKLTERRIRALRKPSEGHFIAWDSELPGFGLRTTANDVKSFILNYRNQDGVQRRLTIGRFPTLSPTAARLRAREMKAKVELGGDPLEAKQTRRGEMSFGELVDLFARRSLVTQKRGYERERYLRQDAIPWIGANTKALGVKRRDVIRLVEEKATTSPIAANRLLSSIRRMYNWAIEQDFLEANPTALVKRPGAETSRDRVLSEDEIRTFWERLDTTRRMSERVRVALRLLLVTAQRPGEICAMEWSEVDLQRGWWEIPREKTKGDRVHRVPLTALAVEQLEKQPQGDRWVFPSVQGRPLRVLALSHALRHNRPHFALDRFTPHDLRRTAASHLAAVGVERFHISKLLNRPEREITGVYDRYTYDKEKRRALERWERKLRRIIGQPAQGKVVSIGKR